MVFTLYSMVDNSVGFYSVHCTVWWIILVIFTVYSMVDNCDGIYIVQYGG